MATLDNVRLFVIDALRKYHSTFKTAHDQALTNTLADYATYAQANTYYVAQEAGKGLSTEDFTTAYMTKLDGIAAGAEVNVQSDWSVSDTTSDAYIANKPNISALFGYAYYDNTGSTKKISFSYSSGSAELYSIDCSDFIIDGMVDSVSIEQYSADDQTENGTSYLYIDFNTAAEGTGHTDIKIPLQNIFNPNNYYDKTAADGLFPTYTYLGNNFYTKTESDELFPTYTYANANYTTYTYVESNYPTYTYLANTYTTYAYTQAAYAYIMSTIEDNEEVIAAALADIDDRLDNLHNVSIVGSEAPAAGKAITSLTVDEHDQITYTLGTFVTSETQLSLGNNSPSAATTGYANVITELSVSNHAITASYTTVITQHQSLDNYYTKSEIDSEFTSYNTRVTALENAYTYFTSAYSYTLGRINDFQQAYTYLENAYAYTLGYIADAFNTFDLSDYEEVDNKKTSLTVAANVSDTYYPSTSAVASYVGSLEELTSAELSSIFAE